MNILPKKRWHVRTKANIERVRRDEANAAEEEKELKRRIRLAEQEARTDLLRKKAKVEFVSRQDTEPESINERIYFDGSSHVNFFKDIEEAGGSNTGTNKEHEEEEKVRKEKFEKDIGLLTYLGQSALDAKGETPWWLKSSASQTTKTDEVAGAKHKSKLDPLNDMKKYLDHKEKSSNHFIYNKNKEEKKLAKKDVPRNAKLSKLEELRSKRLKREAEEKKRQEEFLQSFRKGPTSNEPDPITDDRSRKYNSQFNPHLARNNTQSLQQRFH